MKIVVLAGGLSPERDVSLSSGSLIANSLVKSGHSVALADIYKGVDEKNPDSLFCKTADFKYNVPSKEPDLDALRKEFGHGDALIGNGIIELCQKADAVFLALHGAMGENGQTQAMLDCFGIKYTGSGFKGSVLAMDKSLSKTVYAAAGITSPDGIIFDIRKDVRERITEEIGFPCVIKPCSCGSSVGVSIVENEEELSSALGYAEKYENKLLIEKKIAGREFSVGVLDGMALPPIEIIPVTGFYDYENKYQGGHTREICPADLPPLKTAEAMAAALSAHNALLLGSYSRTDMILSDTDGKFYILETNTLPGMTPMSLLPQEAAAVGITYDALCEKIVELAVENNPRGKIER